MNRKSSALQSDYQIGRPCRILLSNPIASLAIPQSSDSGWLILNDVSKEPREVFSPKLNWLETLVPDLTFTRLSSHALSSQHVTMYLGVSFSSSAGVALIFPSISTAMDFLNVQLEKKNPKKLCAVAVYLLGFSQVYFGLARDILKLLNLPLLHLAYYINITIFLFL